jgi:hypothetical protein
VVPHFLCRIFVKLTTLLPRLQTCSDLGKQDLWFFLPACTTLNGSDEAFIWLSWVVYSEDVQLVTAKLLGMQLGGLQL